MRDIRPDLRERLQSVLNKRQTYQRALDALSVEENLLTKLLQAEDAMFDTSTLFDAVEDAKPTELSPPQPASPLSEVLLDTLKTKSGPVTIEELKQSAAQRGVPFGGKRPGRVIHFVMLGMAQHNLVEKKDGGWMLVQAVN
jgi:hypothetical protein